MKRENQSGSLIRISLTLLIPVAVSFILVAAAFGKTISSETGSGDQTALLKSTSSFSHDSVFVYVDEMPIYKGGDTALLNFIARNTKYPEEAKKKSITGKVIVRFVVGKDCSVSDVTILQSVDPSLDAEAIRVIESLPKFEKPAKSQGRVVAVWYMVPISFALK